LNAIVPKRRIESRHLPTGFLTFLEFLTLGMLNIIHELFQLYPCCSQAVYDPPARFQSDDNVALRWHYYKQHCRTWWSKKLLCL